MFGVRNLACPENDSDSSLKAELQTYPCLTVFIGGFEMSRVRKREWRV